MEATLSSIATLPDISRCETAKREKEPGDTCRHRGHQKKSRPPLIMFPGQLAAEDDESRDDAPEADEDVNEGEDGQAHGSSPCLRLQPRLCVAMPRA
jgi:hypothetical protein